MKQFTPTPKPVIESTIGRQYQRPDLKPPVFDERLVDFTQGRSLEQVLTSLAKPSTTAQNTFKSKPKSKLKSLLTFFTF